MSPHQSPSYLLPFKPSVDISKPLASALEQLEDDFHLDSAKLQEITDRFVWEYRKGLETVATVETMKSFMPMIPTYVQHVPDGTETGTYLALDLGGTNLRVCEVTLDGKRGHTLRQAKYTVSDELKTGEGAALFDFIAESVGGFLDDLGLRGQRLHLGFTFSFPVHQTAINKGTLLSWTKGFSAANSVGKDVVQMLQEAFDRKQVDVACSALVNDTAGTLMSNAYGVGETLAGVIFGTGTNGAYVENLTQVAKMHALSNEGAVDVSKSQAAGLDKMVINTEWGGFDDSRKVLKYTTFDSAVDRTSINVRKHAFEKMISGMYLGEVTRRVILHLVDSQILFGGYSSGALNTHYGLDTAIMSKLEAAEGKTDTEAIARLRKVILEDLAIEEEHVSEADCLAVARVSEIVGTRGCRLSACALAATLIQTGTDKSNKRVTFGADGSLVEFYPRFNERVMGALSELVGDECTKRVDMTLAKDGSGVGAALCAQAAKKQLESGL